MNCYKLTFRYCGGAFYFNSDLNKEEVENILNQYIENYKLKYNNHHLDPQLSEIIYQIIAYHKNNNQSKTFSTKNIEQIFNQKEPNPMLTSTIQTIIPLKKEIPFPKLMIDKHSGSIILVTALEVPKTYETDSKYYVGTVVKGSTDMIGVYSNIWDNKRLEDWEGSILLTQTLN